MSSPRKSVALELKGSSLDSSSILGALYPTCFFICNMAMCYGPNVCIPQKFICSILTSNVMVLAGRVLGRGLGHEGRGLMDKIGALIRDPAELPHPLMSFEDTERRCPPMNQEAGPQQTLDLPKP